MIKGFLDVVDGDKVFAINGNNDSIPDLRGEGLEA